MSRVDAVVMAGGPADAIRAGVPYKGLVEVSGKPLSQWVVEALRGADTIGRIIVTIPSEEGRDLFDSIADEVVVVDLTFSDNAIAGLERANLERPVLMCTGDIPALIPDDVDRFVTKSLASGAAITYPVIAQAAMEARFPGSPRTYFTLDGKQFTGGNCALTTVEGGHRIREIAQVVFDARKSPLQIASLAGPLLLAKFAAGKATTADVTRKASKILGLPAAVIQTEAASLGADVDKAADLPIVEAALAARL